MICDTMLQMEESPQTQIMRREAELVQEEATIQRKNQDFCMIFDDIGTSALQAVAEKSGKAISLFFWMAQHLDRQGAITVSNETLAMALSIEPSNVSRALNVLREYGVIYTLRKGMTVHCVNPDICWRSSADGKQYALFHAAVLADADEVRTLQADARQRALAVHNRIEDRMRRVRGLVVKPTRQRDLPAPVGPEPASEINVEAAGKIPPGPGLKIRRPARVKKPATQAA